MPIDRASTRPNRRRRRAAQTLGATLIGLTSVAIAPTLASTADAVPVCTVIDPPPVCGPRLPEPPEPSEPSEPKPWRGNVSIVDLSESRHSSSLSAGLWSRYTSGRAWRTGTYPVVWSNAAATTGTISIPDATPAAATTALTLQEAAEQGPLCRTAPVSALGTTGSLTVLTAPNVTQTAAQLAAMSSTITAAPVGGPPTTISSVRITPANGVVNVRVAGSVRITSTWFANYSGVPQPIWWSATINFVETVPLTITPHASPDHVSTVVDITSPNPAAITLDIRGVWPWVSDLLTGFVREDFEKTVRSTVVAQANTSINAAIRSQPEVKPFLDQGFTLSFRRIAVSPTGVTFLPSICKLA